MGVKSMKDLPVCHVEFRDYISLQNKTHKHTDTKKIPWRTAKKIKMSVSALSQTDRDIHLQSSNHLKILKNSQVLV